MTPETQAGLWEAVVVLAVGTAAIVALAALCERIVRQAAWQRTLWQAAVLGMLGLAAVELSGAAPAMVGMCRQWMPTSQSNAEQTAAVSAGDLRLPVPAITSDRSTADAIASPQWSLREPASDVDDDFPTFAPTAFASSSRRPTAAGAPGMDAALAEDPTTPDRRLPDAGYRQDESSLAAAFAPWLGLFWAAGTLVLASRIVHARLLLAAFRRRGRPVEDEAFYGRLARLSAKLGIERRVSVLEAAGLASPVAFGVFHPTVALPAGFCSKFDSAQQEAMLAHELAHVAAGDPRWQLVADVACAALWWHPAAWWARRQFRAAGEVAADEASLMVPDGPDVLAGCLVSLGRQLAGTRRLGWLSMAGPPFRSGLGRRVHRLLHLPAGVRPAPRGWRPASARTVLPVAMVAVAIFSTAWARPQASPNQGETAMSVVRSSFGRSLAAAVVAAVLSPLSFDAVAAEGPPEGPPRPDEVRQRDGDRPRDADRERGERRREEARREGERREEPRPEGEEGRRREGPREEGRRGPGPEADALGRQIEVMKMALPALREGERGDAIDVLERAIRAREVTLEGRRDDEAHQIREHAPEPPQVADVLAMAAGLWRQFNDPGKAEEVERLAREMAARRDRPPREGQRRPEEARRGPMDEREMAERREEAERLGRHMQELRERAMDLRNQLGETREEDARNELRKQYERTLDETREVENRLRELRSGERPMGPPEREDVERRMEHLRIAIDNLHAAGLHREADRLAEQAERLIREPRPGERPENPPPPEARERPPQPPEQLEGAIRELREQLERVRREMDELRRQRDRPDR